MTTGLGARARRTARALGVAAALGAALGCGCGRGADRGGATGAAATGPGAGMQTVRLALNWKPEPEFGGLYETRRSGAFAARGLDVALTGGPGAPVVQMLDAGKVEYGIAAADEVVLARDRGADLVAIFATYQTNPQGIMVHASRGLHSLAELFAAGGTLAVEPGLPYVAWLRKRYDLSRMKIVPYGYSIAPFLSDPNMAQQVFVTAEPIAARRQGADPQVFLIAESGFDPYAAVVVTTARRLHEHPQEGARLVGALRAGWRAYLADPGPANRLMGEQNREMDAETFAAAAAAQRALIEGPPGTELGAMQRARWSELAEQLHSLGLVDSAPDPETCFANLSEGAAPGSRDADRTPPPPAGE